MNTTKVIPTDTVIDKINPGSFYYISLFVKGHSLSSSFLKEGGNSFIPP